MDTNMEIGRVVKATAGRDMGKLFMVVGRLDDNYVLIANGTTRSIDKPKKKKIKHLAPQPEVLRELSEKIGNGQRVFDAEIRKSLDMLGYDK